MKFSLSKFSFLQHISDGDYEKVYCLSKMMSNVNMDHLDKCEWQIFHKTFADAAYHHLKDIMPFAYRLNKCSGCEIHYDGAIYYEIDPNSEYVVKIITLSTRFDEFLTQAYIRETKRYPDQPLNILQYKLHSISANINQFASYAIAAVKTLNFKLSDLRLDKTIKYEINAYSCDGLAYTDEIHNEYWWKTITRLILVNLFKQFAAIEVKFIEGGKDKSKINLDGIKYSSELTLPIAHYDCFWFREIHRKGFPVRGHLRMQRCGTGMSQFKLVYIEPFMKKGYNRNPKKLSYNEQAN